MVEQRRGHRRPPAPEKKAEREIGRKGEIVKGRKGEKGEKRMKKVIMTIRLLSLLSAVIIPIVHLFMTSKKALESPWRKLSITT